MPTDPIVERLNLVEEENNFLKEKLKKLEEEKMILELHVIVRWFWYPPPSALVLSMIRMWYILSL